MREDLSPLVPLSPAILHILTALAGEERHGYGIMQEVARQSEGQYKLGPGTLYDNLQKLLEHAVVEECSRRSAADNPRRSAGDDPRRRYYRLTAFGRRVLLAEVARLEGVVRHARLRLQTNNPRRAS
ncbi:MAG: PadR family transcriptional regulator [Acidobacteria bacterium]|nr:MAG: PadR family transcriptional regulator [Acidobacteriota bacterium]